ncbi:hypothetical protein KUTeg_021228, partial [Tegillarca granosa]
TEVPTCRTTVRGTDYKGTINITQSGASCVRWELHTSYINESTSSNYCRNFRYGQYIRDMPWCFTNVSNNIIENCNVKPLDRSQQQKCIACLYIFVFIDPEPCRNKTEETAYKGFVNITETGKVCQRWDEQFPHQHKYANLGDQENYCRSDASPNSRPWCYTTDNETRYEFCYVPACETCLKTIFGKEYNGMISVTEMGKTCGRWDENIEPGEQYGHLRLQGNYCRNPDKSVGGPWCYVGYNKTEKEYCNIHQCVSGIPCQHWNQQTPHKHHYAYRNFKDNYCRNLDNAEMPWCYTLDPSMRWEYCHIPSCCTNTPTGADYKGRINVTVKGIPCQKWKSVEPHFHSFTVELADQENYCRRNCLQQSNGRNYEGTLGISSSGRLCVKWGSVDQLPKNISFLKNHENYCRNPDNSKNPWCYTCRETEKGTDYKGTISTSQSGIECKRWDQHPLYVNEKESNNYCRNFKHGNIVRDMPWCFTDISNKTMEYCYIPMCETCLKTYIGETYEGSVSVTATNRTCGRWDENIKPGEQYESLRKQTNYCRNPDKSPGGPWCYVGFNKTEREYCEIKVCEMDNCKITEKGTEYRGTNNVTLTGKSCQNWNHQFPHKHNFTSLSSEANYCRNPNDAEMPWCYTLHKARIWEYCHIPDCCRYFFTLICADPLHCKNTDNGIDYRGNVNITVSGKSCQKWKSETPHRHGYVDMLGNDENYCRTPDQGNSKPWCYTIDPSTRWEYCFVPTCENCLRLLNGRNFDGSWKKTASGKTCVKWKSVESLPANISFLKNHENYCRNPDNSAKPWCYVDLKGTKEFCKIPLCNECLTSNNGIHYEGEKEITKSGKLCEMWKKYIAEGDKMDYLRHQKNYCRNPNNEQSPWCYIAIDNIGGVLNCLQTITDISYAGTTSITETGKQCQNWNSQKPHRHPFTYLDRNFCRTLGYGGESRPRCLTTDPNVLWEYCYIPLCEKGTEYQGLLGETEHGNVCQMWSDQLPHPHIYTRLSNQKNFCRNPDHSERPWCYTTNPCIEREYCNIPMCDKEECIRDEGIDYLGRKNITKNGRTCQRWDTQSPHVHYFSHLREHENYCRNPSGSPKPWCYTTDPTMRWNYCDLPECSSGECRRTVSGVDYKGKVKVTENGLLCQRWDSQIPHSHNFESLSSEQNYCRNPNGKPRQWCFTTSSSVEFEYCTVPPCCKLTKTKIKKIY